MAPKDVPYIKDDDGCESVSSEAPSLTDEDNFVTVVGFGSLMSEKSARTTFPNLMNFRLGRVPNYRRVFGHPASIFFYNGIANPETLEFASVSAEYVDGCEGFVCAVFDVPNENMMEDGVPSLAFKEREASYELLPVTYYDMDADMMSKAIMCTSSTDQAFIKRWGIERFENNYIKFGLTSIWGWKRDSGLRPCPVYLRHCALAAKSLGSLCYDSFLDDTYLVDRKSTIRDYLTEHPHIMRQMPPPALAERYGG